MSWQNLVMYLSTNNFGGPLKMASTIVNHCLVVELGFNLDIELELRSFDSLLVFLPCCVIL
jgi:hypothetical protein